MTNLLANADRALAAPFKDVFDLVAMYLAWGEPQAAWQEAERQYGSKVANEFSCRTRRQFAAPIKINRRIQFE
jgi:hypothetical protein